MRMVLLEEVDYGGGGGGITNETYVNQINNTNTASDPFINLLCDEHMLGNMLTANFSEDEVISDNDVDVHVMCGI